MGLISRVSSRTYRSLPKYSELKQRPNMSETIECKFNISDYFYTNPDYKVFNLTNFDKHPECKILITNRVFIEKQKEKEGVVLNYPEDDGITVGRDCEEQVSESKSKTISRKRKLPSEDNPIDESATVGTIGSKDDGEKSVLSGITVALGDSDTDNKTTQDAIAIQNKKELIELLIPIISKDFLIEKLPYFKNLFNDDNNFGDKTYIEIDGQKNCLVINDENPEIFAQIIKALYTGELNLTLENCIEVYRIIDFLNVREDGGKKYLVENVQKYIKKNLVKLPQGQFNKILEYNLQAKFWNDIYGVLRLFGNRLFGDVYITIRPHVSMQNAGSMTFKIDR